MVLLAPPMSWGHREKFRPLYEFIAYVCIMIGLDWLTSESLLSDELQVYSLDRKNTDDSDSRLGEVSRAGLTDVFRLCDLAPRKCVVC